MPDNSSTGTAVATEFANNESTRITEWRFRQKGDNTGWHRHEYDYVVVPLFDGFLEIDTGDGKIIRAEMKSGIPYFRNKGIEHDVINGNEFECAFIEVEIIPS